MGRCRVIEYGPALVGIGPYFKFSLVISVIVPPFFVGIGPELTHLRVKADNRFYVRSVISHLDPLVLCECRQAYYFCVINYSSFVLDHERDTEGHNVVIVSPAHCLWFFTRSRNDR